jgi:hypothetical protein
MAAIEMPVRRRLRFVVGHDFIDAKAAAIEINDFFAVNGTSRSGRLWGGQDDAAVPASAAPIERYRISHVFAADP